MLLIAILFTLLFTAMAFLLALGSVHGPSSLQTVALIYLVTAGGVWWWSYAQFKRRGLRRLYFALEGIVLLAMGVMFGAGTHVYTEYAAEYRAENTRVTDVSDEFLLSENGIPTGIRFQFTVRFPVLDYYYIEPHLRPATDYPSKVAQQIPAPTYNLSPLNMRVVAKSVEPFPSSEDRGLFEQYQGNLTAMGLRFDRDVDYRFRFDLAPSYVRKNRDGAYCFAHPTDRNYRAPREVFDAVIQADVPTLYEAWISGTPYGDRRWQGGTARTQSEYTPKTFYEGIAAENLPPCDPAEFVVY